MSAKLYIIIHRVNNLFVKRYKSSYRRLKQTFPLFFRERFYDQSVRAGYQFLDNMVGHIAVEVDIVPRTLVHVPRRSHALVAVAQQHRLFGRRFQTAAVEHLDVHETEPLAADVKTEYIAAVRLLHREKRHLLRHMRQRETIVPKLLYIHGAAIINLCFWPRSRGRPFRPKSYRAGRGLAGGSAPPHS